MRHRPLLQCLQWPPAFANLEGIGIFNGKKGENPGTIMIPLTWIPYYRAQRAVGASPSKWMDDSSMQKGEATST